MNVKGKKSTNESKGKPEQKFDAAFGPISRMSKFFQRSKQKLAAAEGAAEGALEIGASTGRGGK